MQKYASALPPELLSIWQFYVPGTLPDGCFKIINPDEYQDLLRDTYALGDCSIPVFATAFAGLLAWEKDRCLRPSNRQSGAFEDSSAGLDFFEGSLAHGIFNGGFLELARYWETLQMPGPLGFDKCFGRAPPLGLGGGGRMGRKYELREQIAFTAQALGSVGESEPGSGSDTA